jgi:hypothetical protein
MSLAQRTQNQGRDAIELMIEQMIENEGGFAKDKAVEFAGKFDPVLTEIEKFMVDTGKQCANEMTLKQRLRYSADMSMAMAGIRMFRGRVDEWKTGNVEDGDTLLFNGPRRRRERQTAVEAAEKVNDQQRQLAEARAEAERETERDLRRRTEKWQRYVEWAIVYYELDESQKTAARGILTDCAQRAEAVQNEQWRSQVEQVRTEQQLAWRLGQEFSTGPWDYQLEQRAEKLEAPINRLFDELRKRIDTLPTSAQRAAALRRAQEKYEEYGVKVGAK